MNKSDVTEAYRRAKTRLILLDYDGVLAPIVPLPEQAAPSKKIRRLLEELAGDTRNTCVVVSGRHRETLEEWLGDLPLSFAAEHGLWRRSPHSEWDFALTVRTEWKQAVREIMRRYEVLMAGSFIEEKYAGVGIHYRNVVEDTSNLIESLLRDLQPVAASLELKVLDGKKVVEVIPAGVDKGTAAGFWLNAKKWDFILGAGDDVTDEALFKALPAAAYSIKVGDGITHARMRVSSQSEFVVFLETLTRM